MMIKISARGESGKTCDRGKKKCWQASSEANPASPKQNFLTALRRLGQARFVISTNKRKTRKFAKTRKAPCQNFSRKVRRRFLTQTRSAKFSSAATRRQAK